MSKTNSEGQKKTNKQQGGKGRANNWLERNKGIATNK